MQTSLVITSDIPIILLYDYAYYIRICISQIDSKLVINMIFAYLGIL